MQVCNRTNADYDGAHAPDRGFVATGTTVIPKGWVYLEAVRDFGPASDKALVHMSPTAARQLARELVEAADHADNTRTVRQAQAYLNAYYNTGGTTQ